VQTGNGNGANGLQQSGNLGNPARCVWCIQTQLLGVLLNIWNGQHTPDEAKRKVAPLRVVSPWFRPLSARREEGLKPPRIRSAPCSLRCRKLSPTHPPLHSLPWPPFPPLSLATERHGGVRILESQTCLCVVLFSKCSRTARNTVRDKTGTTGFLR